MTTVETAWISATSSLIGALIGASAALGGKWFDDHRSRKAEQRQRGTDLILQFWEVTDRMWRFSHETVELEQQIDGGPDAESADPEEEPESEIWRARRAARSRPRLTEARNGWEEASAEAGRLLAHMRLLNLPFADEASELRLASARFDGGKSIEKRKEAVAAYEEAARSMTS